MRRARAPRTPPIIAPMGVEEAEVLPPVSLPGDPPLEVVEDVVGEVVDEEPVVEVLGTKTVVVALLAPGMLNSMRSIVICELPAGVPRGSAIF